MLQSPVAVFSFLVSKVVDINFTTCVQSHLFFSEWLPVLSGLRKCEEVELIQSQRTHSMDLLLWLFLPHFFNSSCWSELTLLALCFCSYPNEYKAVDTPAVCASFPSCCFCRILTGFGCVNLIGPLNQHHPVCIVSAHLVTLILRESTL